MTTIIIKSAIILLAAPFVVGALANLTPDRTQAAALQNDNKPVAPTSVSYSGADKNWEQDSGDTYTIRKSSDGHFRSEGIADGAYIDFLIDTGATTIALTAADARKAGYTEYDLDYIYTVNTANGQTKAAMITLDRVTLGGLTVRRVKAAVIKDGLSTSLLGMSYLGQLQTFEATPHAMTLRL